MSVRNGAGKGGRASTGRASAGRASAGRADETKPPSVGWAQPPHLADAAPAALLAGDTIEGARFVDADLSGLNLQQVSFLECVLEAPRLDGTELRGVRFVETLVEASFAPRLMAGRSTWRDARIVNPRWGSAELFESEFRAVHISGGKIDFLNLRQSNLTNLLIEDCTIGELDFGGAKLERVALRNCRIGTLEMRGARNTDVDLRSSTFTTIAGLEGLRGVTIDDEQLSLLAPVLAAHLGLRVE